jgi:hypothetical protein
MKAVLALIAIYVAAFIIATQGGSQNPVQASAPEAAITTASKSIDPAKDADLRALLQFVGAKDQLQAASSESAAQYREKLRTVAPASSADALNQAARQAAISQAAETFQKNFDQQRALQQIANIYDKHFTDDEIKGLLDFFSSPLGQKFAAESTKIAKEVSAVQQAAAASAAHDSLEALQLEDAENKAFITGNKPQAAIQDQMRPIFQRP